MKFATLGTPNFERQFFMQANNEFRGRFSDTRSATLIHANKIKRYAMKVAVLITGSGPLVIVTSHASFTDPALIEKLRAKGIEKFIAYEVPVCTENLIRIDLPKESPNVSAL